MKSDFFCHLETPPRSRLSQDGSNTLSWACAVACRICCDMYLWFVNVQRLRTFFRMPNHAKDRVHRRLGCMRSTHDNIPASTKTRTMSSKLSRKRSHAHDDDDDSDGTDKDDDGVVSRTGSRRNFTPEEVGPLASWFKKNIKWPYPDKSRKQNLAAASKLTTGQVQHWFINARMRGHVCDGALGLYVHIRFFHRQQGVYFKRSRPAIPDEPNDDEHVDAAPPQVNALPLCLSLPRQSLLLGRKKGVQGPQKTGCERWRWRQKAMCRHAP